MAVAIEESNQLLRAALWYARFGWAVLPINFIGPDGACSCPAGSACNSPGKHPLGLLVPDGLRNATFDEAVIRSWWKRFPNANIGVRTGAVSGIVVLDVDGEEGSQTLAELEAIYGKIPDTIEAITGSGGRHVLFSHPGKPVKNRVKTIGAGLDARGDDGYIVVAPSNHASGRTYQWEASSRPMEAALADIPEWLLKPLLVSAEAPEGEREPFKLDEKIPDGARNHTLFRYASAMRDKGLSKAEILPSLAAVNDNRCETPLSEVELRLIVNSVMRYDPKHPLVAGNVTDDNRLVISATERDLPVATAQAWEAVRQRNERAPIMFRFGSLINRLELDSGGYPAIEAITPDRLRHELARAATFVQPPKKSKDGEDEGKAHIVPPPIEVVRDMLATREPPLPVLDRIVPVPVFDVGGVLTEEPGFHEAARVYFAPSPDLDIPAVSAEPTAAEAQGALAFLTTAMMGDFPFTSPSDRANALALLLLPYVRSIIRGPTPLHMVEAPTEGSGKGLLTEACLRSFVGHGLPTITQARDDDEWRKRLTAKFASGAELIIIDNMTHVLDSGVIASALTTPIWEDRILGRSEMFRSAVRCVWVATANNPTMSSEIARRCVPIRIDRKVDRPSDYDKFAIRDLQFWIDAHRGKLVWCALTLIRRWVNRGMPEWTGKPMGSYGSWSRVIGGILEVNGVPDFLANRGVFYDRVDVEGSAVRAFVDLWAEKFYGTVVQSRDLLPLALEVDGFPTTGKTDRAIATAFGARLTKMRDRVFGRWQVAEAGTSHRASQWKLVKVTGGEPSEPSEPIQPHAHGKIEESSNIRGGNGSLGSLGSPESEEVTTWTV